MSSISTNDSIAFDANAVVVSGKAVRIASLRDEYYVSASDPRVFIDQLRTSRLRADIFTFVQRIPDRTPKFEYHQEWDGMAVLPLTTYDHWFNKQITFKPRNKIRKAQKSGIEIKPVEFTDELVKGMMGIYDESPVRQGKRNRHYGKDFATVKREHATFLERSDFIGAYYKGELIGFVKVTHSPGYSIIMNILSKVSFREKAPSNLLIDKTVEICAKRGSAFLNYGIWGRRGLNDFKVASAFERFDVPRYFVPLNAKGKLALRCGLHRAAADYLPEKWIIWGAGLRSKWYDYKYKSKTQKPDEPNSNNLKKNVNIEPSPASAPKSKSDD